MGFKNNFNTCAPANSTITKRERKERARKVEKNFVYFRCSSLILPSAVVIVISSSCSPQIAVNCAGEPTRVRRWKVARIWTPENELRPERTASRVYPFERCFFILISFLYQNDPWNLFPWILIFFLFFKVTFSGT